MQSSTYSVTFIADYPGGKRYPLKVEVYAPGVEQAIMLALAKAESSRCQKDSLMVMSVIPDLCPPANEEVNIGGLLKPCPFCGTPHVSQVETLCEFGGEITWFVNCGCCNASQLPDSKEIAIRNWNQRDEGEEV